MVEAPKHEGLRDSVRLAGEGFYGMFRALAAASLHPISAFRLFMLIGDQEAQIRDADRALSIPGVPIGKDRFRSQVVNRFKAG